MSRGRAFALLLAGLAAMPVQARGAEPDDVRLSASLETWLYHVDSRLVQGSLLNPDNRIARLPKRQDMLDARMDIRAESGPFDALLSPRFVEEWNGGTADISSKTGSLRLNQGFLRARSGGETFAAGRERFVWGPATFRSPSNPFYFNPDRTNPLAAPPGIALARYTHEQGGFRATGAYVFSTDEVISANPSGHSALVKLDHQGENHLVSLILQQRTDDAAGATRSPFVGAFWQFTPDDAWLVYGEMGSSRQPDDLIPGDTAMPPLYRSRQPAPRRNVVLLGATYTLESGGMVSGEYLHNSGGYDGSEEQAYFRQAEAAGVLARSDPATGYTALGQAAQMQSRLLGRDYLWLGWQSDPQNASSMWRAELSLNLQDGSGQTMLYGEKSLMRKLSAFAMIVDRFGGDRSEYGAVLDTQFTLGLKWFAF